MVTSGQEGAWPQDNQPPMSSRSSAEMRLYTTFRQHVVESCRLLSATSSSLRCTIAPTAARLPDYRSVDPCILPHCIPIDFYSLSGSSFAGSATLILATPEVRKLCAVLIRREEGLTLAALNTITDDPLIIAGYAEMVATDLSVRYLITRHYLSLLRIALSMGFGLYVEVTGAENETEHTAPLGNVRKESEPVLRLVRMLKLDRLHDCFEPNTLGPVYYREPRFTAR